MSLRKIDYERCSVVTHVSRDSRLPLFLYRKRSVDIGDYLFELEDQLIRYHLRIGLTTEGLMVARVVANDVNGFQRMAEALSLRSGQVGVLYPHEAYKGGGYPRFILSHQANPVGMNVPDYSEVATKVFRDHDVRWKKIQRRF